MAHAAFGFNLLATPTCPSCLPNTQCMKGCCVPTASASTSTSGSTSGSTTGASATTGSASTGSAATTSSQAALVANMLFVVICVLAVLSF
jgi:hypothetical protein